MKAMGMEWGGREGRGRMRKLGGRRTDEEGEEKEEKKRKRRSGTLKDRGKEWEGCEG